MPLWAVLGLCAAGCVKVNENFDEEDILTEGTSTTAASSDTTSTTLPPPTTMDQPGTTEQPPPTTTGPTEPTDPSTDGAACLDEFEPNNEPDQAVGVGEVASSSPKVLNAELEPDGADWFVVRGRPTEAGRPVAVVEPDVDASIRTCIYVRCVEAELEEATCDEGSVPDETFGPWAGCCGPGQASFGEYVCSNDVVVVDLRVRITAEDGAACIPYALTVSI